MVNIPMVEQEFEMYNREVAGGRIMLEVSFFLDRLGYYRLPCSFISRMSPSSIYPLIHVSSFPILSHLHISCIPSDIFDTILLQLVAVHFTNHGVQLQSLSSLPNGKVLYLIQGRLNFQTHLYLCKVEREHPKLGPKLSILRTA